MNGGSSIILSHVSICRHGQSLTDSEASGYFTGAVTAFVVGGMVGALTGGWLADKLGRRKGILISHLPTLLGAIFQGNN